MRKSIFSLLLLFTLAAPVFSTSMNHSKEGPVFQKSAITGEKISEEVVVRLRKYLEATTTGLDLLRTKDGLMMDKFRHFSNCTVPPCYKVTNKNISPTNVALDLLFLVTQAENLPQLRTKNFDLVLLALNSLQKLPYHKPTGLFFNWYSPESPYTPVKKNLSSVDNYHLALAFWTLWKYFGSSEIGVLSKKLFDRMDFSLFYDRKVGLMRGNYRFIRGNIWVVDDYYFRHAGSEARGIYSAGWAIGLFKKFQGQDYNIEALSKNILFEAHTWNNEGVDKKLLRSWNGAAFQQVLPELLLSESKYSEELFKSQTNFPNFILAEQKRRGISVPAGHSACFTGVEGTDMFGDLPYYWGKLGTKALVSKHHKDLKENPKFNRWWDMVATPHAVFLSLPFAPEKITRAMMNSEVIDPETPLYQPGIGWMDAIHVTGQYKDKVVPISLSLDQLMLALSIQKALSSDGMSLSARILSQEKEVLKRMQPYYDWMDRAFKTYKD